MAYDQRSERDYGINSGGGAQTYEGGGFARGRGRRPVTDYGSTMVYWMRDRQPRYKAARVRGMERPSASYIINILPPLGRIDNPADSIPAKHLHSSLNKIKHPVNVVKWTPEGRRLLTASSSGEFTLWNGMGFNFETIQQAHDVAIRALSYSHSDDWLISADHDGVIKYWQPNFNNVKVIQAHTDPVRDLAFSPNDTRFITASDDSTLKIFDFAGGMEESTLTGHGWDAKSVDWHSTKGLVVSGSKDHLVKLWDPRTGRCLTTLHGHKNTITKTIFEKIRGDCLATSARDQTARVFDLRMMRDICLLKGHDKDISTLTWHPIHSNLLSTGGSDGALFHYILDEPNLPDGAAFTIPPYESPEPSIAPAQTIYPAHRIEFAHDFAIWSMDWHPLGHILATGSNDRLTRFWARVRPGETDVLNDRYHIGEAAAEAQGTYDRRSYKQRRQEEEEQEMEDEADGLVDQAAPTKAAFPGIPGLPLPNGSAFIPGMGATAPPPTSSFVQPNLPGLPGGLPFDATNPPDFATLQKLMQDAGMPPPPGMGGGQFPPPPPGFPIPLPIFQLSAGVPPPLPGMGSVPLPPFGHIGKQNGNGEGGGSLVRSRAPLPSQEDSLRAQQQAGNYTRAR